MYTLLWKLDRQLLRLRLSFKQTFDEPNLKMRAFDITSSYFFFSFFFFSSRRRHTRCLSDWSSDVCSSDLEFLAAADGSDHKAAIVVADVHAAFGTIICHFRPQRIRQPIGISPRAIVSPSELGRASGRERV